MMRRSFCFRTTNSSSSPNKLLLSKLSSSLFLVDRFSLASDSPAAFRSCSFDIKVTGGPNLRHRGVCWKRKIFKADAMDEGSFGFSSYNDWDNTDAATEYMFSSSEGEESDGDITLQPISDVDLPNTREHFCPADDSITITAHRFAGLGRAQKKRKTIYGVLNNLGLAAFLIVLLLLVDCCAWKIVRLPLAPYYLIRPFLISSGLVCFIGYICVPLFRILKFKSIVWKERSSQHSHNRGTPTMGGLYFIPVGVIVAEAIVGFSCTEVFGASAVTLAFAAIGLLCDLACLMKDNNILSAWTRIFLEVCVTTWFACWLCTTDISSPYSMKMVVPLPAPIGLVCVRSFYLFFTSISFLSMADGVKLTDELDGLAGGIAALAFTGMSIVVLPICSDLAVFGSSMAGACVGFLFQNRYKASILMGDTGSLALGGALAAMAACSGMFLPLFISSGLFFLEATSVALQRLRERMLSA